MHKILALAQNVGGLSKYMRQMYAANVGVKCWCQMLAANVSGFQKYMRQMLASNLCGVVKLLRHIIYDRKTMSCYCPFKRVLLIDKKYDFVSRLWSNHGPQLFVSRTADESTSGSNRGEELKYFRFYQTLLDWKNTQSNGEPFFLVLNNIIPNLAVAKHLIIWWSLASRNINTKIVL